MKFPVSSTKPLWASKPMLIWLAVFIFPLLSYGQDKLERPRRATVPSQQQESLRSEDDAVPPSRDSRLEPKIISEMAPPAALRFSKLLQEAIQERLGTPYSFGATGPYAFDCSGFVWSSFKEAGITFERSSARSLWEVLSEPKEEDKLKFGTLVFFSGISHVGIVADENGFYHASKSHGVTYSPFNAYWKERIDGFRLVPVPTQVFSE